MSLKQKLLTAIVISKPSLQTLKVKVQTIKRHKMYKKLYKVSKLYLVHVSSIDDFQIGQTVSIYSICPKSKRKVWSILNK